MFHVQERQLSLSSLFKEPIHNTVRHFSCLEILIRSIIHMLIRVYFYISSKTLIYTAHALACIFMEWKLRGMATTREITDNFLFPFTDHIIKRRKLVDEFFIFIFLS